MNSKQLPLSFLQALLKLSNSQGIKAGEITSKSLLKKFVQDGIIKEKALTKSRRVYICSNPDALKNYLATQYEVLSLEDYIRQKETIKSDGEQSLKSTKSTKTFRNKSLQGFFIKAVETTIRINSKEVLAPQEGVELFVHEPEKLSISIDTLVIGIENPECFVKFGRLRHLFPPRPIILVMRYMGISPNNWLQTIPNEYLHFGDFDPAGVSIYINEFRKKLPNKKCSFFIPDQLEELIKQFGSSEPYDNQIHQLKKITTNKYPEIEPLIKVLDKYQKGMEQERLLLFNI